jgi:hypothetical protein
MPRQPQESIQDLMNGQERITKLHTIPNLGSRPGSLIRNRATRRGRVTKNQVHMKPTMLQCINGYGSRLYVS